MCHCSLPRENASVFSHQGKNKKNKKETRNKKQETRNKKQETRNKKQTKTKNEFIQNSKKLKNTK